MPVLCLLPVVQLVRPHCRLAGPLLLLVRQPPGKALALQSLQQPARQVPAAAQGLWGALRAPAAQALRAAALLRRLARVAPLLEALLAPLLEVLLPLLGAALRHFLYRAEWRAAPAAAQGWQTGQPSRWRHLLLCWWFQAGGRGAVPA